MVHAGQLVEDLRLDCGALRLGQPARELERMLKIGRRLAGGVPSRGDLGGQAQVPDRLRPLGTLLEVMG